VRPPYVGVLLAVFTLLGTSAPVSAQNNWTGFYAGANTGYGWINTDPTGAPEATGGFWGGQIGYNYQFARNWVIGVELDGAYARIEDTTAKLDPTPLDLQADTIKLNALATLRARFGYAFERNLLYVTGGAAWAEVETRSSASFAGNPIGPQFAVTNVGVHGGPSVVESSELFGLNGPARSNISSCKSIASRSMTTWARRASFILTCRPSELV
jgi:opacity protein-like surface antigen